MNVVKDIQYAPEHGERGVGDLYLPEQADGAPAALVIHGGGWQAMDKHGLAGVAQFLAEQGYGAYAINYRLVDMAPWPACGDDCLAAARFVRDAGHAAMQPLDRSRLLVIGASAGGHLALMTGLRLNPQDVSAIISISGPTDLVRTYETKDWFRSGLAQRFFGIEGHATEQMLCAASPVHHVCADSPPLLCVHSHNDQLVLPEQSQYILDAYRRCGANGDLFGYDGPGDSHGIWIDGTDPHRLLPEIEQAISGFLASL